MKPAKLSYRSVNLENSSGLKDLIQVAELSSEPEDPDTYDMSVWRIIMILIKNLLPVKALSDFRWTGR